MPLNIPDSSLKRIVIIGAGFAGFQLARKLRNDQFQIVLLDRNNFHQFQPLLYQVAMAGLEPSSIAFPLRKSFQSRSDFFVRVTEVEEILAAEKKIRTSQGTIRYDILVLAMGAKTNFFGNPDWERVCIPMKSVAESLYIRNRILEDFEKALIADPGQSLSEYLDIVIVGGGPTGVELAGSLAEMRRHIIPKDYPDLDSRQMDIYLVESKDRLLSAMSETSSELTKIYLEKLGVQLILGTRVTQIEEQKIKLSDGRILQAGKIIWAAGIIGSILPGIPESCMAQGQRIQVDSYCQVQGLQDVFAIGDIASMMTEAYPQGHPQMAPAAIQQARWLADFLNRGNSKPFRFYDKGQLATIGRNKAVAEFAGIKLKGFIAWVIWLAVHIYYLIGVRNKLIVLLNWVWSYMFYDQNLRLIIKPKVKS